MIRIPRLFTAPLLSLAALGLTACLGGMGAPGIGVDCTAMAVASVQLTVVDEAGQPVADAVARFDSGEGLEDCESWEPGEFVCGWEREGRIDVFVEAPGYAPAEATVDVQADVCHVQTETLLVELEPVDCTTEERPSILARVEDLAGSGIAEATVTYRPDDDTAVAPQPCEAYGEATWACGFEQEGDFLVFADVEGQPQQQVALSVDADVCHVLTEEHTFVFER